MPLLLRPLLWEVDVKPSRPSAPVTPRPDQDIVLCQQVAPAVAPSSPCPRPPTVVGTLPALDALPGESIALFLWSDVRPLGGVAGTIDWRVCGALSRLVERALFAASDGEVLLYPVSGRFGPRRLFLFGLGAVATTDAIALRRVCRQAHDALRKAGASRIVFGAPTARTYPNAESDFLLAVAEELPSQVDAVLISQLQPAL